jgi:hypothetical protein
VVLAVAAYLPAAPVPAEHEGPSAARSVAPISSSDAHPHQGGHGSGAAPSSHEDSAGLKLIAAPDGDAPAGATCVRGAPVRDERVSALAVDITVNRYGDHDPHGRMFAFDSDVARVRDEERRNAAARTSASEPAVTAGLQGDAIQPLVLRVRPGECLRVTLHNTLGRGEAASIAVHGAGLQVVGGGPATVTNPASFAASGATVTYEWQVPADESEGTHYLHSGGDERKQVQHGLFGAVIVEPPGSTWADPRTGAPSHGGWDAVITRADGKAFREFAVIYHEVGDEEFQLTARDGSFIPLVDPLTDAYRPGSRAMNYRSEPFHNRLALGQATSGRVDESLAYSSYAYGDPATPVLRSYVGEPVKERLLHGGSEVFHVHHVHGGSIRWPRQPGAEPSTNGAGLDKTPPLVPTSSERTDSQTLGPSEVFDIDSECGSGGCQQSAGDFLYHCHIAQHYFSGMWGIWRVYNTLQDGPSSTDALPPFAALPHRRATVAPAVPAAALIGTTVDPSGSTTPIDAATLPAWVERQLPPAGTPKGYDASVWDWRREGLRWLGEPETTASWPGYRSAAPGERLEIRFDPHTGRVAYPLMRPHLAARPPFAPNHGPAPFLDPTTNGDDLPAPGASGDSSVCPEGTTPKQLAVNAIRQPVPLNQKRNLVDGKGLLFVLRQQLDAVRTDPSLQVPLAIRTNAGEDCLDLLLRSELDDGSDRPFSKVGLHIHFVQFDVQASDGLDAGFNYEQTLRPFRAEGVALTSPVPAGATSVVVSDAARFTPGAVVGVGLDQDAGFEARRIAAISGTTLAFDRPLAHDHGAGEIVSTEFVRYRWFPDAQFGTAYFHDHVDAIHSWAHGLFGAVIAEPPGSTYTDPHTGSPLLSGAVADIHTRSKVSAEVTGSFRELALFVQDDNKINEVGRSTGSAYGLRAEPLDHRDGPSDLLFSSRQHGDPATALLEANLGDPVVIRSLVGSTNDVHTVHVDGHWFRAEPWSPTSPPINTIRVGISERYDLVVPAAGGPQRMSGDYLYYSGRPLKLREGSWGLVRVHPSGEGGLVPLPGHERVPADATRVCPEGAPVRPFSVTAIDTPLPLLDGASGKVYVSDSEVDAVRSGARPPEPLVLHANVGDCLRVTLTNGTKAGAVTYHCDLLAADPATSGGVAAGNEPSSALAPGDHATFTLFASPEVGETVSMIRDFGDVLTNPGLGLYGAVVIGAAGTTYRGEGWQVDAFPPKGAPYRDVSLFFQDDDAAIGTHRMPYSTAVRGTVGINYTAAPTAERLGKGSGASGAYRKDGNGDPPTPLIQAYAGDRLRLHVLAPWSEQAQVFGVEGHDWSIEPGLKGANVVGSAAIGGLEQLTIEPLGGAGGRAQTPGDYLYGDSRLPYREAGLWGLLRVHPRGESVTGLRPLVAASSGWSDRLPLAMGALALLLVGLVVRRRRRSVINGQG